MKKSIFFLVSIVCTALITAATLRGEQPVPKIERTPTTQELTRKLEEYMRALEPASGAIGKYQLVSGRFEGFDIVFRMDTQTGQVWAYQQAHTDKGVAAWWLALPQNTLLFQIYQSYFPGSKEKH